jgi:signal transduction histidine kinase
MSRKGTKKMKKNYLGFGLVYCVLALVIFSVLMSFYTKKKIDVVNEGMRNIALFPEISMGNSENGTPESLAHNAVNSWKFLSFVGDDVGFYSSIIDTENNGRVMFESQDFLAFRYYGEVETEVIEDSSDRYEAKDTQLVPGSTRFMFFEEPLSLSKDEISDLSFPNGNDIRITGAKCDDAFVYGGTFTFTSGEKVRTLNIASPEVVNEEKSVPYEEWIVRLDDIEYCSLGGNSAINKKAHKLSDAYVNKHLNGEVPAGRNVREGIFTTTSSVILVFEKGHYLITYYFVTHPLKMVIRDNLWVYILSVLALVIVEALIIYAVRKLYLNQKRFELRSEKLTKGIAYDLQGPLAATRGYLDNWEDLSEDKRAEYSEKIISEVDHMSSMVTRLLELSKIHDGSVKLNLEDVDLLKLTQNIKKRNSKAILEKNIDLTIECDKEADAYPVYADLEMMYIVINNFITNAIKYCDHTIKIRLKNYRNSIEFSITNDGAGIEKADLDKVWDVLYKADKGSSETGENSGVGLSVVKSILDAHNAKCGCFSGYKGTNFWFLMDRYEETK